MPSNNYIVKIQGNEEINSGVHYEVDFSKPPIGEGGMGRVYKGVRVDAISNIKRPVAVKFLYEGLPKNVLDRAIREASIKIQCENLIEMIAFVNMEQMDNTGRIVNRYHVISELLDGVMLHDLIKGKTTDYEGKEIRYAQEMYNLYMNDRQSFVIVVIKSILAGLTYLHDAGYVHRDIDTSNIMITDNRKIKLIDFGVAHKMETQKDGPLLTRVGSFLGKAEYGAPELVLGDVTHQNATTDIYAVGILMFHLLTGKLPFSGSLQDVMKMQCEVDVPVELIEHQEMRSIVTKATKKKQTERYQSTAEFRVAIEKINTQSRQCTQSVNVNSNISKPKNDNEIIKHPSTKSIISYNQFALFSLLMAIIGLLAGILFSYILS
jgi:serine/threonine-protein kinase